MTEPARQTRLEKIVGLLARAVAALWVGGVVLLVVNSFTFEKHKLYLVAVGAIRSGFLVAVVILVTVIGSVAAKRFRKKS